MAAAARARRRTRVAHIYGRCSWTCSSMYNFQSRSVGEERGERRSVSAFDGGMLQWQERLSCCQHQRQQVLQLCNLLDMESEHGSDMSALHSVDCTPDGANTSRNFE